MASIVLRLEKEDGNFKEYRKEKVKAYWVKEAFKLSKKVDELSKAGEMATVLEERLNFTCLMIGDKELTPDIILDGLQSDELFPTLDRIFRIALGHKPDEDLGDLGNQ